MRRYQQAFTLIEMMVTVAVLAIVFAMVIPSLNQQVLNGRSLALGEDLAGAFNLARTEAVKRGTRVSVCASSNGTSCSGGWNAGFIAYVDTAAADTTATTTVGQVLKYWTDFDTRTTLVITRNNTNITFIRYTGLGTLARNATGAVTVASKLTGCSGNAARTLTIGLSGLINVVSTGC